MCAFLMYYPALTVILLYFSNSIFFNLSVVLLNSKSTLENDISKVQNVNQVAFVSFLIFFFHFYC